MLATSLDSLPVPGIKDFEPVQVQCGKDEAGDYADHSNDPDEVKHGTKVRPFRRDRVGIDKRRDDCMCREKAEPSDDGASQRGP